jgi:hypothetical protein
LQWAVRKCSDRGGDAVGDEKASGGDDGISSGCKVSLEEKMRKVERVPAVLSEVLALVRSARVDSLTAVVI